MDKNAFLRELALILRDRNLTDDEIRIRIEKISAFLDGLSPEERNAVIGGNPNVAAIADRLFSKGAKAQSADENSPKEKAGGAEASNEGAKKKEEEKKKKKPAQNDPLPIDGSPGSFRITSDYKKKDNGQDKRDGAGGKNVAEVRRRDEEKLKKLKTDAQAPKKKENSSLIEKYESERNFWIIFFCCIPLIFFAAAVVLSVFALLFCSLVGVIIMLIGAMALAVSLGTGVSLVGIFYGVVEVLGGNLPAGLYEAGLGIISAGITMLVGVLMYNAAIRFIPWLMKLLKRLFKFLLKKIGIFAEYLKGVFAAL